LGITKVSPALMKSPEPRIDSRYRSDLTAILQFYFTRIKPTIDIFIRPNGKAIAPLNG
jgi:hypothetical protein